jgi:uncharacterized protein (TIGR03086 family)
VDTLQALDCAIAECGKRLALIGPSDWDRPTPCDQWNVRDLVYHIAWGSALYANLVAGARREDFRELPVREDVDADPVAHCRQQAAALAANVMKPGAMELVSDSSFRPGSTGAELTDFRTLDLMVHTWDLSRAIGADETLPTPLVEHGLISARTEWGDIHRSGGYWREVTTSPTSAEESPLWQLLRATGRKP